MKTLKLLLVTATCASLFAASAQAGVTITHTTTATTTQSVGATVTVDVVAGYDGTPAGLSGIFTSAQWDEAELTFVSASAAPFILFAGAGGILSKAADPGSVFPGDAAGSVRTIQFGAGPGQSGGAGPDVVVTTLTFTVAGAGDGNAEVDVFFNNGDIITGAGGAELVEGSDFTLTNVSIPVPEPTSTALGFSVLGVVGLIGRLRSQRA